MINRKETYLQINKKFGKLSIKQVEGFEAIFNAYESFNVADKIGRASCRERVSSPV